MLRFIANRLGQSLILLLIVTLITFFLINLAPGGPSGVMRMDATEAERQAMVERFNLDQPILVRYIDWVGNAIKGDLGISFSTSEPVIERVLNRLPYTLELSLFTIILAVSVGIVLGVISAIKRGTARDYFINFVSVIGLSVPAFWLASCLFCFSRFN